MPSSEPSRPRTRGRVPSALLALLFGAVVYLNIGLVTDEKNVNTSLAHQSEFNWNKVEPTHDLQWVPCYSDQQCARLLLPLDHDIPDGPTTAIAIRMIPATDKENYRGTRSGKDISRVLGPAYDVLSFDPRGIGYTTPLASCFDSKSQRDIWKTQEGHMLLNFTDASLATYRSRAEALGQRCAVKLGGEWGIGRFAGTAYVARDMLEMTKILGQEQLQYWGFSYGTALGQYFAAMYPENVKRIILDGVIDGHSYRRARYETDIEDVQNVADTFFAFCHAAGADKCVLYESTPAKIRDRFYAILDAVTASPVAIPLAEPPLVVTRKALAEQLFEATYRPIYTFPVVAATYHALETGNATALRALAPSIVSPTACACAEAGPHAAVANEARWAVERLTAPVAAERTAHPLLLLSNRFDPVTPLAQARRTGRGWGRGAVGAGERGHCSTSSPSVCTAKVGVLPEEGATCEVDVLPFVGERDGGTNGFSEEDRELAEA
ncbi:alpha/beta-hydrolase [Epithele typhae]|uniref:alpha/beta-hydrolase n=1 Tax=Epithele typhae TaxID=378194 RepID=UPI0020079C12|nr:alpha/beta-hydrolase [Epithele typhae]KAH9942528.1 alpha/beta-hydrolase [Epithele typhae]